VLFLEEQFGIEVADNELVPANLDSIERIASFVARKRVAVNAASEIVSKTTLTVEVSSKLKFEKAPSSSEALRAVTR
jgi:hypothetical protein